MKALLIHTAHRRGEGEEACFELMAAPQGLFALASLLDGAGHDVEVLHLGLEAALDRDFDLERLVRRQRPDLVALALHWHHGALDVQEAAEASRRGGARFIVLGGITATLLAGEVLSCWPEVDAVIRGDAERPLLELCEALAKGGIKGGSEHLGRVSNLTWRGSGGLVDNGVTYCAGPDDVAGLCFSRLDLMRHDAWYSGHMTFDPVEASLSGHALMRRFNLPISRGCFRACPRCGGARTTLGPATGRAGATFIPVDAVVRTMGEVLHRGVDTFYASCHPADADPGYYSRLLRQVQDAGLECALELEAFADLPGRALMKQFAQTFSPRRSRIILSPGGGLARRRRTGVAYSDGELFRVLDQAAELGINLRFHVSLGPPDTEDDVAQAVALTRRLRKYGDVIAMLDEVDPGAPWAQTEESLRRRNDTLEQILEGSRLRRANPRSHVNPGYPLGHLADGYHALRAAARER